MSYVREAPADDLDRRLWEFADGHLGPDLMRYEIDAWFAAAIRDAYRSGQRDVLMTLVNGVGSDV